jgi:hypothetical protein
MMFTSQLCEFTQSRTLGMARTALWWNTRKNRSGSAAITPVSR